MKVLDNQANLKSVAMFGDSYIGRLAGRFLDAMGLDTRFLIENSSLAERKEYQRVLTYYFVELTGDTWGRVNRALGWVIAELTGMPYDKSVVRIHLYEGAENLNLKDPVLGALEDEGHGLDGLQGGYEIVSMGLEDFCENFLPCFPVGSGLIGSCPEPGLRSGRCRRWKRAPVRAGQRRGTRWIRSGGRRR